MRATHSTCTMPIPRANRSAVGRDSGSDAAALSHWATIASRMMT